MASEKKLPEIVWVYKVRTVRASLAMEVMRTLGREGWELAGVRAMAAQDRLYFKKMELVKDA